MRDIKAPLVPSVPGAKAIFSQMDGIVRCIHSANGMRALSQCSRVVECELNGVFSILKRALRDSSIIGEHEKQTSRRGTL